MVALAVCAAARAEPPQPVRDSRFTTSDKAEIRYLDRGPKNASRALLFIPGWRFTAEIWQRQIDDFSHTLRVIAIDPRSQGASSKTTSGNTPERRATDLHELLAALDLRHVVLVGWSQGVQDAAAYLGQYGSESLDAVVLVDSPVAGGAADLDPVQTKNVLSGLAVYVAHPREHTEGMLHAIIRTPLAATELSHLVETALQTPTDIGVAMLTSDLLTVDRRPSLAKCDRPALIIAAADSPSLNAQRKTADALHARFEAIEAAGHVVFYDQPERFDALLHGFIEGLPPAPDARHH